MTLALPWSLSFLVNRCPSYSSHIQSSPTELMQTCRSVPKASVCTCINSDEGHKTHPNGGNILQTTAIPTHNCGCGKAADNVSKHHLRGVQPPTRHSLCCLSYPGHRHGGWGWGSPLPCPFQLQRDCREQAPFWGRAETHPFPRRLLLPASPP